MLNQRHFLLLGNFVTRLSCRRHLRNQPRIGVFKVLSSEENESNNFPPLLLKTKPQEDEQNPTILSTADTEGNNQRRNKSDKFDFPKTYSPKKENNRRKNEFEFTKTDSPAEEPKKPKSQLSFSPVTEDNMYERLAESVVPLAKVTYFKQLKIKQTKCVQALQHLAKELKYSKVPLTRDSKGMPFPIEQVRPSPQTVAYRNKDEFGIRPGIDGNPKTVGFFIGSPADNSEVICIQPKEDVTLNIKPSHLQVVEHFQRYIRQSSLPACINFTDGGNWHHLLVRSNDHGDLMVVASMHPQKLSEDEIDLEKDKLKEYFTEGPGKELNVKSLFFQACKKTRCTNQEAPFQLLSGEPHIFEQIGDLKMRISPETSLQINTSAAPVLYETIRDLAGITNATTVLDVCCGAGFLGMHLAEKASRVIGIDISQQAADDAKYNLEANGVKNMAVIQGPAEVIVPRVMDDFYSDDLVAVVNPPRAGLKKSVINALRECKHLRRIVYVSCKPEGEAMANFVQLCINAGKNRKLGPPFRPLYAVPVDLFPHTHHCELVIMFERAKDY